MADITSLRRIDAGLAGAVRWKISNWLTRRPGLLNLFGCQLTVFDLFGAPGDTLLTGTVCRHVHERFPRIRINCLTPNPDLLRYDPNIKSLNRRETYICLWHNYLGLVERKDKRTNLLRPTMDHLGITHYEYRARIYLSDEERAAALKRLGSRTKPIIAFNTKSKEPVKNWPEQFWIELVERLRDQFTLVHLGDSSEPEIAGTLRLAGILTMRESMALLACAQLHVGPDSFLMHVANGVGLRSVIIFGGSRTPESVGYDKNTNLFTPMPCGPCWIHENRGEKCGFDFECLKRISVDQVQQAIMRSWTEINEA